ncbi:MAG: helix-turn-helix domain-containing protein [Saprospiraceae bacterium]|nr:helix-turn-helix domain-containing protein [Saprospiraceae bacterium]
MANKPVTMNRIRLIMQSLSQGESIMEISRKYGISRNTIKKYRTLFSDDGLICPLSLIWMMSSYQNNYKALLRKKIIVPASHG